MASDSVLHFLEWSEKQKCFHIQPICRSLTANVEAYQEGVATDYKPVFMGTLQECNDQCEVLHVMRDVR
jgi:hypothetical protein